jgi:hypothetical protein
VEDEALELPQHLVLKEFLLNHAKYKKGWARVS